MDWEALFERTAGHDTTVQAVREALARRRADD